MYKSHYNNCKLIIKLIIFNTVKMFKRSVILKTQS